MSEFPEHVMVCQRWNAENAMEAGVQATVCNVCDASIVISKSSRDLIAKVPRLVPVCPECMQRMAEVDTDPHAMIVTEETRLELMERTGMPRETIDELVEYAKKLGPAEAARRVRAFQEKQRDS